MEKHHSKKINKLKKSKSRLLDKNEGFGVADIGVESLLKED